MIVRINSIWIMCTLLLLGCALPLQQPPQLSPDQIPQIEDEESAGDQTEDSNVQAQSSTDRQSESDEDASRSAPVEPAGEKASVTESTLLNYEIEQLDLAAEDETFLEAIARVRNELQPLVDHQFVQIDDAEGERWQGEILVGDSETVLFLQKMQSGGRTAVRITVDTAITVEGFLSAIDLKTILPNVNVDPVDPSQYDLPDAEILLVRARETDMEVWNFDVRIDHPDTGWEDYTDGWHVETLDGRILGVRILLHPHVNEMPFTRSQGGIRIPENVTAVQVRSHDLISGYSQDTVIIPLTEAGAGENYEVIK